MCLYHIRIINFKLIRIHISDNHGILAIALSNLKKCADMTPCLTALDEQQLRKASKFRCAVLVIFLQALVSFPFLLVLFPIMMILRFNLSMLILFKCF